MMTGIAFGVRSGRVCGFAANAAVPLFWARADASFVEIRDIEMLGVNESKHERPCRVREVVCDPRRSRVTRMPHVEDT